MAQETVSLKNYFAAVDAQLTLLEVTEPAALIDDDCSVVSMAPVKGGVVGLDLETGRPTHVDWKYKTIDEKPVIIHVGSKQTVIPPKPKPQPVQLPTVTIVQASNLFEAMHAQHSKVANYRTPEQVMAKNIFVKGCMANPAFFLKWAAKYAEVAAAVKSASEPEPEPVSPDWPLPSRTRQRIVDT